MNKRTSFTTSDGDGTKKETLTRARAHVHGAVAENVPIPSEVVHPVLYYKTPKRERTMENKRRRMETLRLVDKSKLAVDIFFAERIVANATTLGAFCSRGEIHEAYSAWCQAEGVLQMTAARMLRMVSAKLIKIHGVVAGRRHFKKSTGPDRYPRGFIGIRIRPLRRKPKTDFSAFKAAAAEYGCKFPDRIAIGYFHAAIKLGLVDLTDAPESPSLRDGEQSGEKIIGGES